MSTLELTTDRIKLKMIELSDLDSIHKLLSLPETDKYNTLGIPRSISETKSIVQNYIKENQSEPIRNYSFKIETKENNQFLGLFGLKLWERKYSRAEVWYKILPEHWNKGYATESVKAVLNHGFDIMELHRIEAGCAVKNIASIKILEKVGMTREGRGRQILPLKSGWSDNFTYSILKTDIK